LCQKVKQIIKEIDEQSIQHFNEVVLPSFKIDIKDQDIFNPD